MSPVNPLRRAEQIEAAAKISRLFEGPDAKGRFFFKRDNGQIVHLWMVGDREIQNRRNALLGPSFRFTWPNLPKGAKFV